MKMFTHLTETYPQEMIIHNLHTQHNPINPLENDVAFTQLAASSSHFSENDEVP